MFAIPALVAFSVSFAALYLLLSRFARVGLDRPNERSLHNRLVPRTGGLAIAIGATAGFVFAPPQFLPLLALVGILAAVSFADDLFGLPASLRLALHLVSAAAAVWMEFWPLHPLAALLFVLGMAWMANLYNFMDGADGLAGGMAVIGFGAYALAAGIEGHVALVTTSLSIAAASAAFLRVNFPPARIFMGDVGSIPIGFLAGALGLAGWREGVWPIWFPLLVFAPFACDATLTLGKRLLRRERVLQAHREHYYQRLVRMGFSHRATARIEYTAMFGCAGTALYARTEAAQVQAAMVAAAAIALGAIAAWIDVRWARHRRSGQAL